MESIQDIIKEVLPHIIPTPEDRLHISKTLRQFTTRVQQELDKKDISAIIEVVGSIAKDTYLKQNLDIDVFLLFNRHTPRKFLAEATQTIGKTLLEDTEECYAEHPYIRGLFNNMKIELVPGYQIEDARQKISAVDRTPLHTKYIQKHISEKQKTDVRVFKQFLHGIDCYGAEAEIQGFSGYLSEILILYYHSFQNLIQHGRNWTSPVLLNLHQEPIPDFFDPLVFIDPVDPDRNVASAVSEETFQQFITACNEFLKKPKTTFFFPNSVTPWPLETIKTHLLSQETQYIGIKFSKPDLISENLIPQVRKTCRIIKDEATRYDFIIHDITFTTDTTDTNIYIIINTERTELPETYTHVGPPTHLSDHRKKFEEKWDNNPRTEKGPYEHHNRIYVKVKRSYQQLIPFLHDHLSSMPLSTSIKKEINTQYKIEKDDALVKEELQVFWTKYFDKKYPWER